MNIKKLTLLKISKTSYGIIIPKAFVDNGMLHQGSKYDIDIKESEEEVKEK